MVSINLVMDFSLLVKEHDPGMMGGEEDLVDYW